MVFFGIRVGKRNQNKGVFDLPEAIIPNHPHHSWLWRCAFNMASHGSLYHLVELTSDTVDLLRRPLTLPYLLHGQAERNSGLELPMVGADEWHTCLQPLSKFLRRCDVDCVEGSDRMAGNDLSGTAQNLRRDDEQVPLRAVRSKLIQCRSKAGAFDRIFLCTPAQGSTNLDGQNGGHYNLM
jgi:hypothetical protein